MARKLFYFAAINNVPIAQLYVLASSVSAGPNIRTVSEILESIVLLSTSIKESFIRKP